MRLAWDDRTRTLVGRSMRSGNSVRRLPTAKLCHSGTWPSRRCLTKDE